MHYHDTDSGRWFVTRTNRSDLHAITLLATLRRPSRDRSDQTFVTAARLISFVTPFDETSRATQGTASIPHLLLTVYNAQLVRVAYSMLQESFGLPERH